MISKTVSPEYAESMIKTEALYLANQVTRNIFHDETCQWKLDGYLKAYEELELIDYSVRPKAFKIYRDDIHASQTH